MQIEATLDTKTICAIEYMAAGRASRAAFRRGNHAELDSVTALPLTPFVHPSPLQCHLYISFLNIRFSGISAYTRG